MNEIRVLSVEDHGFVSDWLESRLEEEGLRFVGHLPTADDLPLKAKELDVNLAVLDVSMPGADPFSSVEDLRRMVPGCQALFLSAHVCQHHVKSALDSGALGYYSKTDHPDDICRGIRSVASGRFAFGDSVLEVFPPLRSISGRTRTALSGFTFENGSKLDSLTPREREVLRLIGRGLTRVDIAQALHRSPKTIDKHRAAVMEKLDIHDRAELVLYAVREGLVEA